MTTEQQETRRPSLPGDIITSQEQLDALPENSYVQALGDTRHWRKKAHHGTVRWSNPEGGWLTPGTEWADHFSTLGHQVVVDTINRPIEETPEQFAARFRDIVLWSEESHYGGTNISLQVLNDLGEEFAFKPSVGMRLHAQHDLALLPNGTRVYTGDPADAQTFGLWVKQDAGWTRLFGGTGARRPQNSRPGIIDALPDGDTVKTEPDEWWLRAPTPEEHKQVADLRRKAWRRGYQEKVDHGWCNTFESLIKRAGLSAEVTRPTLPQGVEWGATLTPEQVAKLDEGTYLYSLDPIGMFQRVSSSTNRAGTRRVGEGKGHYADRMVLPAPDPGGLDQVARFREAGFLMPVLATEMLDRLPPGSMIGYIGRQVDRYVKRNDGTWNNSDEIGRSTNEYAYPSNAFDTAQPNYGIIRIGEPA